MFKGLNTALITPFKNGKIDIKSLEKLVELQIQSGVDGIVPTGTTGESPTLSHQEHIEVIKICVDIAKKRVKIIAGTGSNSTKEAVDLTNEAAKVGADASLSVAPYYNKPSKEGVYQHFKAINDNCNLPIIIYNIPGRSVINITDEEIAKLALLKNVIGVKDATGDLARVSNLRSLVGEDFLILSGEDASILGFNAMGGNGIISVTSNILPKKVKKLVDCGLNGDIKTGLKLQRELHNLNQILFMQTNPIPIKYAAHIMGLCSDEVRLPLTQPNDDIKNKIKSELAKFL